MIDVNWSIFFTDCNVQEMWNKLTELLQGVMWGVYTKEENVSLGQQHQQKWVTNEVKSDAKKKNEMLKTYKRTNRLIDYAKYVTQRNIVTGKCWQAKRDYERSLINSLKYSTQKIMVIWGANWR